MSRSKNNTQHASISGHPIVPGCVQSCNSIEPAGTRYELPFLFFCDLLTSLDVPADELSQFNFWVEYAAASYCHDNYVAKTGDKLTCWADNCPQVEQADTEILYDFSK